MKRWNCECGAVLGIVERTTSKVRWLRVLPTAAPAESQDAVLRAVKKRSMVRLRGDGEVTCSVCGKSRAWRIGQEALTELLARTGAGKAGRDG